MSGTRRIISCDEIRMHLAAVNRVGAQNLDFGLDPRTRSNAQEILAVGSTFRSHMDFPRFSRSLTVSDH